MLKYIYSHGESYKRVCADAIYDNCLDAVMYLSKTHKWNESDTELMLIAAYHGSLDIIKYLHESGCPKNYKACSAAASKGKLDHLKYMHENGFPWNYKTCSKAALYGKLDCLKFAHANGCE
jgi:hypothetical protein